MDNVRFGLSLLPRTQKIAVVTAGSPRGEALYREFAEEAKSFDGPGIVFLHGSFMGTEEMLRQLRSCRRRPSWSWPAGGAPCRSRPFRKSSCGKRSSPRPAGRCSLCSTRDSAAASPAGFCCGAARTAGRRRRSLPGFWAESGPANSRFSGAARGRSWTGTHCRDWSCRRDSCRRRPRSSTGPVRAGRRGIRRGRPVSRLC